MTTTNKSVFVGLIAALAMFDLAYSTAASAAKPKNPKPGSEYSWQVAVDGASAGTISISLWSHPDRWLAGNLQNSTSFIVDSAIVHLRQYQQPLDRVIVDSPIALVQTVPPGHTMEYFVTGSQLGAGCAVVIDSVNLYLVNTAGRRVTETLRAAPDAEPFWYAGCIWEKRKYDKSKK